MIFQKICLICLFAFGSVVCYERMQYSDSDLQKKSKDLGKAVKDNCKAARKCK